MDHRKFSEDITDLFSPAFVRKRKMVPLGFSDKGSNSGVLIVGGVELDKYITDNIISIRGEDTLFVDLDDIRFKEQSIAYFKQYFPKELEPKYMQGEFSFTSIAVGL